MRATGLGDTLWVRVLDLPAALTARPWYPDGEVVLEVDDPLGHTAGRCRVVTRDGAAEIEATDAEPAVRMGADTLGSPYLGGVRAETLHAPAGSPGPRTASDPGRDGRHRPRALLRHRLLTDPLRSAARTRLLRGLCSSSTRPSPSSSGGRYIPNRPR